MHDHMLRRRMPLTGKECKTEHPDLSIQSHVRHQICRWSYDTDQEKATLTLPSLNKSRTVVGHSNAAAENTVAGRNDCTAI